MWSELVNEMMHVNEEHTEVLDLLISLERKGTPIKSTTSVL